MPTMRRVVAQQLIPQGLAMSHPTNNPTNSSVTNWIFADRFIPNIGSRIAFMINSPRSKAPAHAGLRADKPKG